MKNHRIVISRHGGPETLELIEETLPDAPRPGHARVRVLGSGVAYGDVLKREAILPGLPATPFTPGYDLVGEVVAGSRLKPGTKVAAFILNGGHAEYADVPDELLVPVPEGLDPISALVLVLNYVTAWQMLHRVARVKQGETILIHGAAGGVGTAMLELAKLAGVRALGTASSGKHRLVRELGGEPIDYKSEDFVARARELTGGQGVDAVFDPIGGTHLSRSWAALNRNGGRLVCYGVSETLSKPGARKKALLDTFTRLGWYMLPVGGRRGFFYGIGSGKHAGPEQIREDLGKLLALLSEKKLSPVIGARFALKDARKAHELLDRSGTTGKIVLDHRL